MLPRTAMLTYKCRVKTSKCRGLKSRTCSRATGCKFTKGKKRSFCRKTKNNMRRFRRSIRKMK